MFPVWAIICHNQAQSTISAFLVNRVAWNGFCIKSYAAVGPQKTSDLNIYK